MNPWSAAPPPAPARARGRWPAPPALARALALALTPLLALGPGCAAPGMRAGRNARGPEAPGTPPSPPALVASAPAPWLPLFPNPGAPAGWVVRSWNDVTQPAPPEALWEVVDGVLLGSRPRGTWLVSEREYGDFVLEFEFRLGERGQSGVGLRFPIQGDPAVEGLEIQLVDPRYFGTNTPTPPRDGSGAVYQAVAPATQRYRPNAWNSCRIACQGAQVSVTLNGQEVNRLNLDEQEAPLDRGQPLSRRPRRGHLGFQEVSRGTGVVEIRGARIQVLD